MPLKGLGIKQDNMSKVPGTEQALCIWQLLLLFLERLKDKPPTGPSSRGGPPEKEAQRPPRGWLCSGYVVRLQGRRSLPSVLPWGQDGGRPGWGGAWAQSPGVPWALLPLREILFRASRSGSLELKKTWTRF